MIGWVIGIVVFLVVWTLSSFVWVVNSLGEKNGPGHWYDYVFAPPIFAIFSVLNWFRRPL